MERYNKAGGSATPPTAPAAPADKYYTSGNPGGGVPATKPGPWLFHMLTEEIRAVVVEGGLTPDHTNLTQLRDAIKNISANGDFKPSVRIASTSNIASLSGLAAIDGITPIAGDRILLKNQSTASQNGIYLAASGAWTRAIDADTGAELNAGAVVYVEEGTANGKTNWQLTTTGAVTIGTTGLTFSATSFLPTGTIIEFAGTTAPAGYLNCPTSLTNISRTTYAALFAAIGTTWGAGDGSTTFGLPWFPADYVAVQANANVGSSTVGAVIGHVHSYNNAATRNDITAAGGSATAVAGAGNTASTGGSANLAAGVRVLRCVKY